MVSLQPTLSPNRRKAITEYENLSKKRKLQEGYLQTQQIFEGESTKLSTVDHIELHLESPLPLEWQDALISSQGRYTFTIRGHKREHVGIQGGRVLSLQRVPMMMMIIS
ncbi:hypothetical protein SLA2020_350370 [Shorea laevis]